MIREFREFIARGNVVDLAVGIIIGAAFTAIVSSLVNDIISPVIGLLTGGINFNDIYITLRVPDGVDAATLTSLEVAQAAGATTINIGVFVTAVINFLIVAFVVFLLVKAVNRLKRREEVKETVAPTDPLLIANQELTAAINRLNDQIARRNAAPGTTVTPLS